MHVVRKVQSFTDRITVKNPRNGIVFAVMIGTAIIGHPQDFTYPYRGYTAFPERPVPEVRLHGILPSLLGIRLVCRRPPGDWDGGFSTLHTPETDYDLSES